MSFTAYWRIYDETDLRAGARMTVTTPADVEVLVARLAEDTAEAAKIEHHGRARLTFEGESAPDHILVAGVAGGYGYFEYADDDHEPSRPVGDPASPVYHSDSDEYPAGSGLPIEAFTAALCEFLATARRPACVDWRPAL
ncbi:Imm1 family immunity protein [Saccharothrix australiensis]|uniref:Immunity protein Imm1 of predicted polymorphic toxin system n=1 Tax=Saccharothrix australiensis TaxID=2072 RepID=A0A495W8S0_9PSEU|nr:Imm1 family immunity protein [Saccharothrix australiensis]RKT57500.1 immunity protein Imm1 of predicted polymorphic toxin system [Saccharothrix australiensis]